MTQHRRSLFGEILDWMLAPLLVIWPISIAISYGKVQDISDAVYDRSLEDNIALISQHLEIRDGRIVFNQANQFINRLRRDEVDRSFFAVRDTANRLIAGNPLLVPDRSGLDWETTLFSNVMLGEEGVRVATSQVYLTTGREDFVAYVSSAETLAKRKLLVSDIIKGIILPQLLILPLLLPLIWFALSRGLSSLTKIQQTIRNRQPDDLSPINASWVPEETMPLVTSFNELLERLEKTLEAQKNFIANAAHQLKTPIAGLQTHAELARRLTNAQERDHSLALIAVAAARASRVINQLLMLARSESLHNAECESCDLVEIMQEVTTQWVDKALNNNIDLGIECDLSSVKISAMPEMLKEMLENLIDNALRYGSPDGGGGVITVRLYLSPSLLGGQEQEAVLEVEDNGNGLTVDQQHKIFERFYRISQNTEGSGLGLAIVQEIAAFHGGKVEVFNRLDLDGSQSTGSLFRITLPLQSS